MKFKIFDPTPEGFYSIKPKGIFSAEELGPTEDLIKLSFLNKDSLCAMFGTDEKIYGILGSYRTWGGCSQAWATFDEEVDKYPIALTKVCRSLILYAVAKQELRRISLTVRSDYTKGDRFVRKLGFSFEGRMNGFLPDGCSADLYARLF